MPEPTVGAAGTARQILPVGKACLRRTRRTYVARALLNFDHERGE